jgi:hypothetical protein
VDHADPKQRQGDVQLLVDVDIDIDMTLGSALCYGTIGLLASMARWLESRDPQVHQQQLRGHPQASCISSAGRWTTCTSTNACYLLIDPMKVAKNQGPFLLPHRPPAS